MFIIIVFRLCCDKLFSCFFAGFLLFSSKGSVTGCDFSLGSFCYSPVLFISRSFVFFPASIITAM